MSPGARGRSSCGSGTGGGRGGRRGGAAPPLRLPPGAQPRGPASGHPCRAGDGRCSSCCAGARGGAHSPGARTPAPLRLGRAEARAAVSCALQRRRRRRRPGEGGGSGRGRDESPRGEGAAAQPLPQRPGRRPLHRPLRWRRDRGFWARADGPGIPGPSRRRGPPRRSLEEFTPRVPGGLRGRLRGKASDFSLWRSSSRGTWLGPPSDLPLRSLASGPEGHRAGTQVGMRWGVSG